MKSVFHFVSKVSILLCI